MCGRFVLVADPNLIQQSFNLDTGAGIDFAPRYNIAPTQYVPVITNEQPKTLSLYRWGLIPSWAKEEAIGNKMINARADGIATISDIDETLLFLTGAICPGAGFQVPERALRFCRSFVEVVPNLHDARARP